MTPPIKNFINKKYPHGSVTQWFAENPSLYQRAVCIDNAPCHPSMTCPSGQGCLISHNGIDVVAPWGTPIYAVEGGRVTSVKNSPDGYGKHCRILTDDGNEWTYGHASENLVKVGQRVKEGEMIQKMGNTGFVVSGATPYWQYNPYSGTHLHLGLRRIKNNVVQDYHNGYFGSVDFRNMLNSEEQTKEIITLQLTVISLLNQIISLLRMGK